MLTFGSRLRELREEKQLTQQEFAELLSIGGKQIVSGYEKGKSEPDLNLLIKIAEFFNVSIDFLLGRTEFKNPLSLLNLFRDKEEDEEYIKRKEDNEKLLAEVDNYLYGDGTLSLEHRRVYKMIDSISEFLFDIFKDTNNEDFFPTFKTITKAILQIKELSMNNKIGTTELYEKLIKQKNWILSVLEEDLISKILNSKFNKQEGK